MSPPTKEEMIQFLKDPNLIDNVVKTVQSTGVIGEELPIKTVILVCCGKLVLNKKSYSTNLHPEDMSGIGKDYVTEHVMGIVFYKDWIKYNAPTPTALSYSQLKTKRINENGKEEWITEGPTISKDSIVYIKDASEEFLNGDDCKLLLEEKNVDLVKTMNQRSVHLKWEKPVVIITTAGTNTDNQIIRRLPSLHLNCSADQTRAINKFQLDERCNTYEHQLKYNSDHIELVKNCFYELSYVGVDLNNVRDEIKSRFLNCNSVLMRSLYPRLLDYISFSTALYQFQREKSNNIWFANKQDVKIGFEVFDYIYKDELNDVSVLNNRQRNIRKKLIENYSIGYTIQQMMGWKESEGVRWQTLQKDLNKIVATDTNVIIDHNHPAKYRYERKPSKEDENKEEAIES